MARISLTQNLVRELLNYNPETGIFTWRYRDRKHFPSDRGHNVWNAKYSGKEAGSVIYGYIQIKIFGYEFFAHRLAYLYMTGSFLGPGMQIDHIDRNRSNNRFENLRVVSSTVNMQNTFNPYRNNKVKVRGVRQTLSKKFDARIRVNNKCQFLGTFSTAEEAHAAYLSAKKVYHPGAVFSIDDA